MTFDTQDENVTLNVALVGPVFDHSPEGLKMADALCAYFPSVDERVSPWRALEGEFFVYFHEAKGLGRAGSMTARHLNDLLSRVLPSVFGSVQASMANPSFGIAVANKSFDRIAATIDCLTAGYHA